MATFITVQQSGKVRKVKITTRKWTNNRGCPTMYDVLIDGEMIAPKHFDSANYSAGRVLTMGRRFLPVLDDGSQMANFGSEETRAGAADWVAMHAIAEGFLPGVALDTSALDDDFSKAYWEGLTRI